MKRALAVLVLLLLGYVGVTWWALEASEVAVLETTASDGSTRQTHVWFVEPDGELWLEAGTPDNPWFADIRVRPELQLHADRRSGRYRAEVLPGPESPRRVRALLREKYGWRDAWVGVWVDGSRSMAVRLVPAS